MPKASPWEGNAKSCHPAGARLPPSQLQLMGHGLPSKPGQQVVGRQHCHGAPRGIRGTPDVWQNHCRGQGGLLAHFLPFLQPLSGVFPWGQPWSCTNCHSTWS